MPSALNTLLKKFDDLAYDTNVSGNAKAALCTAVLVQINALFADPDYEINRDLFDSVSNDTRRMVVAGFITTTAVLFKAHELHAKLGSAMQANIKPQAASSEANPDTLGTAALDQALRAQKRGVN